MPRIPQQTIDLIRQMARGGRVKSRQANLYVGLGLTAETVTDLGP